MTNAQLKAAKEVLEPLLVIYLLQGYLITWCEDEDEDVPWLEKYIGITAQKGKGRYTLWIDIDADEKGLYSCETDQEITWSKLKRLPNQIDYHVREFLKTI